MARIFVDGHMFGEDWFRPLLEEMHQCEKVLFVYSEHDILRNEMQAVRRALRFFQEISRLKCSDGSPRRIDVDKAAVERHIEILSNADCFGKCEACDDPHIFALVFNKPTPFIFSKDLRIAECRDKINKSMDKRYCQFALISNSKVYNNHRSRILK